MRYWLYKCNTEGGPAGYWGDWESMVFHQRKATEWGGHYSSQSPRVWRALDEDVAKGDVVIAYQTDDKAIIGSCVITAVRGPVGDRKIFLRPVKKLRQPLKVHRAKQGTPLEQSKGLRSRVMLTELDPAEVRGIESLAGLPPKGFDA